MGYFCRIMEKTYEELMLGESAWLLELEAPTLYNRAQVLEVIQESVKVLPPQDNSEIKIEERLKLNFRGKLGESPALSLLFLAPPMEKENPLGLELLDKMAHAIGLSDSQYSACFTEDYLAVIAEHRPQIVVGLGVLVNQVLLANKEKLASMRGREYPLSLVDQNDQEHRFLLTPLFHPDFLLINPNMKKMAWEDLQRIQNVLR